MSKITLLTMKLIAFLVFVYGSIRIVKFTKISLAMLNITIDKDFYVLYMKSILILFIPLAISILIFYLFHELLQKKYNTKKRCKKIIFNTAIIFIITVVAFIITSIVAKDYLITQFELMQSLYISKYSIYVFAFLLESLLFILNMANFYE